MEVREQVGRELENWKLDLRKLYIMNTKQEMKNIKESLIDTEGIFFQLI